MHEDVDIGELQLSHYRLSKNAEHRLSLGVAEGELGLKPGTDIGSGKPHDPEKERLAEIIEALNEIFGAEISDEDQLQLATGIVQRLCRQADVVAQIKNHSDEQIMHGLFPTRLRDAVLDAMNDHEKMSLTVLESEASFRSFILVALRMAKALVGAELRQ